MSDTPIINPLTDPTTPNYGLTLPTVGADDGTWGGLLNANFVTIDTVLLAKADKGSTGSVSGDFSVGGKLTVSGATKLAGLTAGNTTLGTLSATTTTLGATSVSSLTTSGNIVCKGIVGFGNPPVTDFVVYVSGTQRVFQWTTSVTDVYSPSSRYWNVSSGPLMSLANDGSFQVNYNAYKPGGGSWSASSDDRGKTNVAVYATSLEQVCALEPISFEYNGLSSALADGRTHYGLSAQSTQPIMPELVQLMPESVAKLENELAVDTSALILALVNCVRELRDRVVALEAARA